MGFWDKIEGFFAEDESWKRKEAVPFEGKLYGAWVPEEDPRAAWPNALCARCGGVRLKKEMCWNKETDTWYHRECIEALKAPKE